MDEFSTPTWPGQTSGSQSKQVGDFKVTALSDGYFDLPISYFVGLEPDMAQRLGDGTKRLDVNAFLIETPGQTVLVDTGCGDKLGPTVNRLIGSLRTAGVEPSSIDTVLCTHIHPDHTNGLVDAFGAAIFPNAQVIVQADELAFWLGDENLARADDEMRTYFSWARSAFAPYRDRTRTFRGAEEVAKGISALPLFGHTPGHSGFVLDGGGDQQMLIWGDCVHAIDIQTECPEVTFAADVDQAAARACRTRLFDQVATDNIMVTGMHVTFPGFGRIARTRSGFAYTPES